MPHTNDIPIGECQLCMEELPVPASLTFHLDTVDDITSRFCEPCMTDILTYMTNRWAEHIKARNVREFMESMGMKWPEEVAPT